MVVPHTIGAVMTPSPQPIDSARPITEAKALMADQGIHHLAVVHDGLLESVISQQDIERVTLPGHKMTPDDQLLVSDITPTRAYVADIHDPLRDVLTVMADRHLSAVIVLEDGELAGIFTETDACRVLAALLERADEAERTA